MSERTFLIQRYCSDNYPQVRGIRPFVTAGPRFFDWVVSGSIEKRGQHTLRPQIKRMLADMFPVGDLHQNHYQHQAVSEVMLREGVLSALWSVDSRECLPVDLRWEESVRQVARELPFRTSGWAGDVVKHEFWSIHESVEELLSGMQSLAMAREYVSEDRLTLEPVSIPVPRCPGFRTSE